MEKSLDDQGNWYLCTISKQSKHNWPLCKEVGLWGIPSSGRKTSTQLPIKNDNLLIYQGGKGFLAVCKITGITRSPKDKSEAPWAGGVFRYGKVVPFKLLKELEQPIPVKFKNGRPEGFDFNLNVLRRGFGLLTSEDGRKIQELIYAST